MLKVKSQILPPVLTIAGSDSIGGAGIQADLKTMTALKCFGMSVISMLTAQNTMGVQKAFIPPIEFLEEQLLSVFDDVLPLATKTGALFEKDIIKSVVKYLRKYDIRNIIVDPVMVCTANRGTLLKPDAVDVMKNELFSVADLITPNIPEAEVLCGGIKIDSKKQMEDSAKMLSKFVKTGNVLVKGGHFVDCCDCLLLNGEIIWLKGKRVDTKNTHGTGCSLSSAIVCNLALGFNMLDSVKIAKQYVFGAIRNNPNIGKGCGAINHCWKIKNKRF